MFKIGEGVSPVAGPFKGSYGTVIFFDAQNQKYLVRFGSDQQLYFKAAEIKGWGK